MVLEIHNQGQIPLETGDYRKYVEEERRWCSKEVREEYGVSVWKAIKSERKVIAELELRWETIENFGRISSMLMNPWERSFLCYS